MNTPPVDQFALTGTVRSLTQADQRRAAVTVCARAVDVAEAREMLAMLGLVDGSLRPDPNAVSPITHGTASAVRAHRAAKSDLCKPCKRWGEVEDRKSAPRSEPAAQPERSHGTSDSYVNGGCRCEECRDAGTQYRQSARRRLAAQTPFEGIPHGTENGYANYMCRCEECRDGHAAYSRDAYRRRTTPAGGGAA